MSKWIPISLWIAVFVFGSLVLYQRYFSTPDIEPIPDGRVFKDVSWKHTPTIGKFQLTDHNNTPFLSQKEVGQPMLFYFFYATCPNVCRQLNGQVNVLSDEFRNTDMKFVGLTVDPESDTPELLKTYKDSFGKDRKNWRLLTGEAEQLRPIAFNNFRVPWKKYLHTEKLFLVDRWGRIRDFFEWDKPDDIQRLRDSIRVVLDEKSPPLDLEYKTRYGMIGTAADLWESQPWIREFKVTDHNNKTVYSKDLTGKVWVSSFFFSTCPSICKDLNKKLATYQSKLKENSVPLISISTDGKTDTPEVLKDYRRQFTEDSEHWQFTTGDPTLVKKISAEFFGAPAGTGHHSSDLFVVDKWGTLRGRFDWRKPAQETQMWDLIKTLNQENQPPKSFKYIYPSKPKFSIPKEQLEED